VRGELQQGGTRSCACKEQRMDASLCWCIILGKGLDGRPLCGIPPGDVQSQGWASLALEPAPLVQSPLPTICDSSFKVGKAHRVRRCSPSAMMTLVKGYVDGSTVGCGAQIFFHPFKHGWTEGGQREEVLCHILHSGPRCLACGCFGIPLGPLNRVKCR